MSEAVERRLLELLDNPTVSPFGWTIPGLDELGADDGSAGVPEDLAPSAPSGLTLAAAAEQDEHPVRVLRICESLQSDESLLAELRRVGAVPGGRVLVSRRGERVRVGGEDGLSLGPGQAVQVIVAAG